MVSKLDSAAVTGNEMELPQSKKSKLESAWLDSIKYSAVLGSGAFGVVLKAIGPDASTSAVKIIVPNVWSLYSSSVEENTKEKERIHREYANASKIQNENVVRTLALAKKTFNHKEIKELFQDLGKYEGAHGLIALYKLEAKRLGKLESFCLQMELCGETLRSWLKINEGKEMDQYLFRDQVGIVTGLIEGLKILHEKKILHRDFKPENIYFTAGHKLPIKIGDFGLSRQIHNDDSKTSPLTSRIGTSTYRAPELNYTNDYSYKADLYSLGLVIWEVLQVIRENEKRRLFDKLVYVTKKDLIKWHPVIGDYAGSIVKLTRRNEASRAKNMDDKQVSEMFKLLDFWAKDPMYNDLIRKLEQAKEGETIELEEGEYIGPFDLRQNCVTIRGKGDSTIFTSVQKNGNSSCWPCLRILGNDCKVTGIKVINSLDFSSEDFGIVIQGSHNTIENTKFEGGSGLKVVGDFNTISNLRINKVIAGIKVGGNLNTLNEIYVQEDIGNNGTIEGNGSPKSDVKFRSEINFLESPKSLYALTVDGHHNKLRNIECICGNSIVSAFGFSGVSISRGSGNRIENLKCIRGLYEIRLYLYPPTNETTVRESECDLITICGSGHKFVNVGSEEIRVSGEGHYFENCKGEKCIFEKLPVLTSCSFEELKVIVG